MFRSDLLTRYADPEPEREISALRVSVARLTLQNFRCHGFLRLEPGPQPVVLTGANGAGKTSVLEALSLLAPGRGLRRAALDDLARCNGGQRAAAWAVAAMLRRGETLIETGTGVVGATTDGQTGERRQVQIDGRPARGQTALADVASILWLTPDMDRLFLESPGNRRRFLDRIVYGLDPAHAGRVSAYERSMRERTRLLKGHVTDRTWLAAVEDTMATLGIAVAAARQTMAATLAAVARHSNGPFPGAEVDVTGEVEAWLAAGPALEAEDRFRAALEQARASDTETGGAACGPHRSDVVVRHRGSGRLAGQCSTGEQKALLIRVVLAAAHAHQAERGLSPLLLLDEVAAHLDGSRRQALFESVADLDAQAWYTGTDLDVFQALNGTAQVFELRPLPAVVSDDAAMIPRGTSERP